MTTTNSPTAATGTAQPSIAELLRDSGPRPDRPSSMSAALSFGWRALLKIKHVPEQLFDVTMFPVMFTLMFTFLFGGALAGSTSAYIQFLLPGILVQTVVMITMYTGLTLNKDIEKGVFDRFRSLPIWRPAPLVGALLGDVVRYTLASTIVLVLGLALGFRPAGGVLGVLASVALLLAFSFCVSWVWTMFALMLRSETAVMSVSMLVLFPLTFASNIFVDPTTMPGWLQAFVSVNPVSHLVTTLRGFADGVLETDALMWTGIWSVGLLAVFGPITMRLYNAK
ncbi:ABC transporter permease [Rhodococcus sp. BP-149]|jgi:ABC-2 type transport system permease protein|uniref:ABC transporter permease n=1 Tax=unclassified Rhodococcus (in: high G+C Gram-positive bacteria) TaxID=192944 RepID=UPI001C9AA427|nr:MULTISPECIES: ABC transporter permease [unclassified Rhodococcus (in: high G+C Gram-positive bacteria)]MBY6675631.1 ABC transporter permease [Rhodococcus sp. BP-332]MBY6687949.1 ABC transporter permease [Rhodococcus sp. BP-288]MBY6696581.1 ABC transporter permease [Rhodococcus sp. BP-188]MBY6699242.1 ABC transporter permease [Rhodococcus sp. BP-285]MBY6702850.1 ABC transporter permease [Rhodococcus sp. BP-283]